TIFTHAQESRTALSDRHLVQFATQCGVDGAKVQEELDGNVHEERVRADFMGGVRSGVNGTPTFFVNGTRFDGDSGNVDAFADALERSAGVAQR
ncbi:MAG: DsbA family protein, partial [Gemmatimonadaceae bacterium]